VSDVVIRPLGCLAEAEACARMMAASEPWITLGRGYEASLALLVNPEREVYVAVVADVVAGFVILNLHGAFVGYIQTVCVAAERRGGGIGARLVSHAEARIFRESPNVFLCRRFYQRLGYTLVGELTDYLVTGHSELLFRKTIGPIGAFRASP